MIVFTTDHGDSLGDRGMLGKRAFYNEVARVPLLFHVPWISQDEQRLPGQFGHVDLTPTILDLLGQDLPSHLQGASRAPALRGKNDSRRGRRLHAVARRAAYHKPWQPGR